MSDMKKIKLGKSNSEALIGEKDYKKLGKYKWHLNTQGYAVRSQLIYMHREIKKPPAGFVIDHINGDKLDNRRENLRICYQRNNARNRKGWAVSNTRFKGVSKEETSHGVTPWRSSIMVHRKNIWLGSFPTQELAAFAYNQAAKKYYGSYAYLNNIGIENKILKKQLMEFKKNYKLRNTKPGGVGLSKFKGVYSNRHNSLIKIWKAQIHVDNKAFWLGSFNTEKEAALAYNEAAKKYHGEFALLNKVR